MIEKIIQNKLCPTCKTTKDISQFGKHKSAKNGIRSQCKHCIKVYNSSHKEDRAEYCKAYYAANTELLLIQKKTYYFKNKQVIASKAKVYRAENKETIAKRVKLYSDKNKEKIALHIKLYRQTPKGKLAHNNTNYKRRSTTKQGDVTTQQLLELQQSVKHCYWCGISLKKVKIHIDHYVPLSKGGLHTLSNLVVSCQNCNCSKQAKDPLVFANSLGKLL